MPQKKCRKNSWARKKSQKYEEQETLSFQNFNGVFELVAVKIVCLETRVKAKLMFMQ